MNEHREPKYDGLALVQLRHRHDAFVDVQAERLGVEPSAILTAVKDFGLCAADISELTDKSGLTKSPNAVDPISLKVLDMQPVNHAIKARKREFTASQPKAKKKVKRGHPARQQSKPKRTSSAWPHDRGATSMGEALKRVGLRK